MFIRIYDKDRKNFNGIRKAGDWNRKKESWKKGPFTKPIGFMRFKLDEKDVELCWNHDEILDLIKNFHKVDMESIEMITNPEIDTGEVKNYETPFIIKIQRFIDEFKEELEELQETASIRQDIREDKEMDENGS